MAKSKQIARFEQRMAAIPKAVRAAVQPALDRSADELTAKMKELVPVESGELRDSIQSAPGEHELSRRVFTDDVKARWVEFGTSKMHAEPFFWLSFDLLKKRIANRTKRAITKAVKDHWAKP